MADENDKSGNDNERRQTGMMRWFCPKCRRTALTIGMPHVEGCTGKGSGGNHDWQRAGAAT